MQILKKIKCRTQRFDVFWQSLKTKWPQKKLVSFKFSPTPQVAACGLVLTFLGAQLIWAAQHSSVYYNLVQLILCQIHVFYRNFCIFILISNKDIYNEPIRLFLCFLRVLPIKNISNRTQQPDRRLSLPWFRWHQFHRHKLNWNSRLKNDEIESGSHFISKVLHK